MFVPAAGSDGVIHGGGHETEYQTPFTKDSKQFVVVLKIRRLKAGEDMASLCSVVIRGISSPCEVLLTSSIAELSEGAPVMLTPIPCDKAKLINIICEIKIIYNFFNIFLFQLLIL
jgi:hypothetical protein